MAYIIIPPGGMWVCGSYCTVLIYDKMRAWQQSALVFKMSNGIMDPCGLTVI